MGDERQGRTGQQLLELMGAQDVAVEIGLPHARAWPGAVQQRGLSRHQTSVLGEEAGTVLPVALLLADTPELLPSGLSKGRTDFNTGIRKIITLAAQLVLARSQKYTAQQVLHHSWNGWVPVNDLIDKSYIETDGLVFDA